jgi:enoyl-[acyl-carrier protein] reductase I
VDCGYNTVSMPTLEQLKAHEQDVSAAAKGRPPGEAAE